MEQRICTVGDEREFHQKFKSRNDAAVYPLQISSSSSITPIKITKVPKLQNKIASNVEIPIRFNHAPIKQRDLESQIQPKMNGTSIFLPSKRSEPKDISQSINDSSGMKIKGDVSEISQISFFSLFPSSKPEPHTVLVFLIYSLMM